MTTQQQIATVQSQPTSTIMGQTPILVHQQSIISAQNAAASPAAIYPQHQQPQQLVYYAAIPSAAPQQAATLQNHASYSVVIPSPPMIDTSNQQQQYAAAPVTQNPFIVPATAQPTIYYIQQHAAPPQYPQHVNAPTSYFGVQNQAQPAPLFNQGVPAEPFLTWKQKKKVYGRSNRLRQLADELTKKDQIQTPFQMSDYYIHNDKDNTSASETANSHADGPNQPDSGRKAGGFNSSNQGLLRNKREKYNKNQSDGLLHIPTYADEVDGPDYLDQNNQTVSEILSMLSGSEAQSSDNQIGKLKGSEEQLNNFYDIALSKKPRENANVLSYNDFMMQDKASQQINQMQMPAQLAAQQSNSTNEAPAGFFDGPGANRRDQRRNRQVSNNQFMANSHSKLKNKEPQLLSEGDFGQGGERQIYYDKSSCMHAPKATQVPIF